METLIDSKVSIVSRLIMEVKDRIVLNAHELFMKKGVRSVSMDEIALQLGISKKTIYQFFEDKDALVENVMLALVSEKKDTCGYNVDNAENPIHEFFIAETEIKEVIAGIHPSMINDLQKYHPKAYSILTEFQQKFLFDIIKSNLLRGIETGLYKNDIDIDILSVYRLNTVFLLFNSDAYPPKKFNIAKVLFEVSDNFLHGIATAKGNKLIEKYKNQRTK